MVLLFLLFFASLFSEELEVKLAVDRPLIPVYISSSGEKEIDALLQFDFGNGAFATTLPRTAEREKAVAAKTFDLFKKERTRFLLIPKLEGRALTLESNNLITGEKIQFGPISADSRSQLHKLTDKVHKALFGVEGVASTRILFTDKIGPSAEVYVVDYDGGGKKKLTSQGALAVTPAFAPPESGKISSSYFYVSYKTGQPKIYLASLSGGNGERVSPLPGNQLMPTLSRDRHSLYFISDASGNPDLFMQPIDPVNGTHEKPRQIFAVPYATQASPTLSPDGKKIAFVSSKDGTPKIYVINTPEVGTTLKEIQPKLLVKRGGASTAPAWSPDGKKIAYTSKIEGTRQIFVYHLDSGDNQCLTSGPGNKENPTWAPNSLHLAFNFESGESCNIAICNLNQPKLIPITTGKSEKKYPSWEMR